MFGRMYNERGGQWGALLVFVGFNVTFFPQFIMGSRGMPRRYARYDPEYQIFHQLSTIGAIILGIGLLIAGYVLITSLYRGKRAPGNPWGAATLEFQCCSPPTFHNFEHDVIVNDPYDYSSIEFDEKVDGYVPVEPAPAEESAPNPLPAETT